jgi:drug/metabolite transporter (DMT)-like permease
MITSANALPVLATMAGAMLIGLAPVAVRLSELGPQATAFWRLALASAVLVVVWLALRPRRAERVPTARRTLVLGSLAGLFFALDLATWHVSIHLTTVANATLLANLTPIPVALGAWLLFRTRPSQGFLPAALVGLVGAATLSGATLSRGDGQALLGDGLAVLTSVWYAVYILLTREVRAAMDAVGVMTLTTLTALPFALVFALAAGEPLLPPTPVAGWDMASGLAAFGPLLVLGLVSHLGGQGALAWSLGRLPADLAVVLLLVQPVVSAGVAWQLFDESFGPLDWLGSALVAVAVVLAARAATRSPAASLDPVGSAK